MSSAAREKTLILMRHSKAEEGHGIDHDRELSPQGERDARAAGAWLRDEGLLPDLVICSTAVRTRQTWDAAVKGGAQTEFLEYRKSVYQGGPTALVETVREDAGDMASVLVIGHNPAMAEVATRLCDGAGSTMAHEALGSGFAASGIAVLRFAGEWTDLDFGACELMRFHVARDDEPE